MKLIINILIIFFSVDTCLGQWISLEGSTSLDQTKLYIETRDWPQNLEGFNIKKRSLEGSWKQLNSTPIAPQIDIDRDWTNLGLTDQQAERVRATLTEYLQEGQLQPISAQDMVTKLKAVGGLGSGDRLRLKEDFQLTLIIGFGFIDNTYEANVDEEYGVFFVTANGEEKGDVLAVYHPQSVDMDIDIHFLRKSGGIQLRWQLDSADVAVAGIFSFDIYRGQDSSSLSKIRNVSVVPVDKKDAQNLYQFTDANVDAGDDHFYAVSVVNKFQEEIARGLKRYQAALYESMTIPNIDTIITVNDVHNRLFWQGSWDRSEKDRVEEIVIERSVATLIDFHEIGATSRDSVAFTDSTEMEYGTRYLYRLNVRGQEVDYGSSETFNYLYLGSPQAKTPAFGDATFEMVDGEPHILLTWQKKDDADSATVGYLLYSDEVRPDTFLQLASVGTILTNSYRLRIGKNVGRTYRFRIQPINDLGERAPYLELSVDVGALRLPPPGDFSFKVADGAALQLDWSFPEQYKIRGFNIYMNGVIIADTSQVGPDTRTWRISKPAITESGSVSVQVEALGEWTSSLSREKSLYLPRFRNAALVPPPDNLEATLKKEKKLRFAEVKWEVPDTGDKRVIGYQLWIDEDEEGSLIKQQQLLRENILTYQLPDLKRDAYTFRVAAVNEDRKQGPPAEVTLALKKKKRE